MSDTRQRIAGSFAAQGSLEIRPHDMARRVRYGRWYHVSGVKVSTLLAPAAIGAWYLSQQAAGAHSASP